MDKILNMVTKFKPMKGVDLKKVKGEMKFPVIASIKLDGIRCVIREGKLFSSHNKEFKNPSLLKKFDELIKATLEHDLILDGELYSHELEFNVISGNVRSLSQEIHDSIQFHAFDLMVNDINYPYEHRVSQLLKFCEDYKHLPIEFVEVNIVTEKIHLDNYFGEALEKGFEGLITRQPDSLYKYGRATPTSQDLLKHKPFVTDDAKIVGITERYESIAEAEINEMGKSTRSHKKEFMQPTGIAASFECIMEDGREVSVPIGQTEAIRKHIFENPNEYIGRWIEFKFMEVGVKEKPRHPNFVRWRDDKND